MNLLFANDKRGAYPPSWYADTVEHLPAFDMLKGGHRADVCIVGAGYTGLSAALTLAQAGRKVIVLDAQRVGFGASGRNGGQLGSGQRVEQPRLEQMFGRDTARHLWALGEDAKAHVKGLIADHDIACHLRPGIAWAAESATATDELHRYAAHMAQVYDYDCLLYTSPSPRDS